MLRLRPTIRSLSRNFHRSCINLDAVVVSGTKLANTIRANVAEKVINYNKEHFGDNNKSFENFRFQPSLTILQVGSRPDSSAYVKSKLKAAASSNIKSKLIKLDESISQEDLVEVIERLNKDPKVHGILVQLPLQNILTSQLSPILSLPIKMSMGLTITMLANYRKGAVHHTSNHVRQTV